MHERRKIFEKVKNMGVRLKDIYMFDLSIPKVVMSVDEKSGI